MPRFFIDFDDGEHRAADVCGRDFVSKEEAIGAAEIAFQSVMETGAHVIGNRPCRILLRDEQGAIIFEISAQTKPNG